MFNMNYPLANIIPVTKAREKLGDLATKVKGEKYVILTNGGQAEAALVDIDYLNRFFLLVGKLEILKQEPEIELIKKAQKYIVKKDAAILAEAKKQNANFLLL
jgi:PHD/YefM family antitoxin component YafN of YafNO toxin-antitoxin module